MRRFCSFIPLLVLVAFPSDIHAQEEIFTGEARVTAADLLVELRNFKGGARKGPEELSAEHFRVLVKGQSLPVVALESPQGEQVEWTTLLYLDRALVGDQGVAWAAVVLRDRASELVRMGAVELVVADPEPELLVRVSRGQRQGAEALRGALSSLLQEATALPLPPIPGTETENTVPRDGRSGLEQFRAAAVEELSASQTLSWATSRIRGRVGELAQEETAFVRRRLDALTTFLLRRRDAAQAGELALAERRALFWATDGYDADPARFYRTMTPDYVFAGWESSSASPTLEKPTEDLARLTAAYGWTLVALLPPPAPSPLQPGVRIGKLRLYLPGTQGNPQPFIPNAMVGGTYETNRDPELAESHLALGQSYREAGRWDQAEEALRMAIYHFDGDPSTAERQAEAWRLLGQVLEAAGDPVEGRKARAVAVQLNPESAEQGQAWHGGALDPSPPLIALAEATAGRLVRDTTGLAQALDSLKRRYRLTYQWTGLPQGRILPVQVELDWAAVVGKEAVEQAEAGNQEPDRKILTPNGARWVRSATPESVAELRLRGLLNAPAGALRQGGLPLAGGAYLDAYGDPQLSLRLGPVSLETAPLLPRLSLVTGDEDGTLHFTHHTLQPFPIERLAAWRHTQPLITDGEIVLVLLEDLVSGKWGMAVVEVP